MYYVNREGIASRLACVPELGACAAELASGWTGSPLQGLAQERALHLAAEIVTDVGSALIDGFLMRDASSYEDIIDIIAGEGVIEASHAAKLRELVSLRRKLVQEYDSWPRRELHALTGELPAMLREFAERSEAYIRREMIF